jgi:hypothetical protein
VARAPIAAAIVGRRLRAEMADLKTEMNGDYAELKTELK